MGNIMDSHQPQKTVVNATNFGDFSCGRTETAGHYASMAWRNMIFQRLAIHPPPPGRGLGEPPKKLAEIVCKKTHCIELAPVLNRRLSPTVGNTY